jgi:hypothetical protein
MRKTNLVDLLWYSAGEIKPLVNGTYNRNLQSIRPGNSVETLYRLVGRRPCDYFRSGNGKWQVKFIYPAYKGRQYLVEADASDGTVTYAHDASL